MWRGSINSTSECLEWKRSYLSPGWFRNPLLWLRYTFCLRFCLCAYIGVCWCSMQSVICGPSSLLTTIDLTNPYFRHKQKGTTSNLAKTKKNKKTKQAWLWVWCMSCVGGIICVVPPHFFSTTEPEIDHVLEKITHLQHFTVASRSRFEVKLKITSLWKASPKVGSTLNFKTILLILTTNAPEVHNLLRTKYQ